MKKARYTKQFTISLPAEEYDRIKTYTESEVISMAEYIREALEKSKPFVVEKAE
jgi:predicted DNA-binding protein